MDFEPRNLATRNTVSGYINYKRKERECRTCFAVKSFDNFYKDEYGRPKYICIKCDNKFRASRNSSYGSYIDKEQYPDEFNQIWKMVDKSTRNSKICAYQVYLIMREL